MQRSILLSLVYFSAATVSGLAQPAPTQPSQPPQAPIVSPEVHADRSVTFRHRAPNAKEVLLSREGQRIPMQKDDTGVWTVTTPPLEPDMYGYLFVADGVLQLDPLNSLMKPNLLNPQSMVHVPGAPSLSWDITNVPHGEVHRHFYHSGIIGDNREFYVYTPPGYDPLAKKMYPTLYLFHGFSDGAEGWTAVGHANFILDNLIAQGKAKPMLIVMTLGYGAPEIVSRNGASLRDAGMRQRNYDRFRDALFSEVMPMVEKDYRVSKDRNMRAVAGLSMGGAESLLVGLNAIDKFAYVGSFSAGGAGEDYAATFPSLDAKTAGRLNLLWVACGTDDRLIASNRKFLEWLQSKNIQFTRIETPGAHTWMVWRRNLTEFAPLLFQPKGT